MTCRPLLWITAAAVSVGAAASTSSIATAAEPGVVWTITIDGPATEVVASKHLTIEGSASNDAEPLEGAEPLQGVTVTVVPQGLPPQCGSETGAATVEGDRYVIELDVDCNGPHQIEVVAQGPSGPSSGEPRTIGVAEAPPKPVAPILDVTSEGDLKVTWDPGTDPDAEGSILVVNVREDPFPAGIGEAILPPADRRVPIAVRTLRWGADGPGTTISSPESDGMLLGETNPNKPQTPNEPNEPEPPPPPPPTPEPPAATPPDPSGPGSPTPPSPDGTGDITPPITPPPSTSAPATTLPADHGDDPPDVAPKVALALASALDGQPSSDTEERAISTAAPGGGLVRTTERQPPGLVAPLATSLVMICIAVQIAWFVRRSRPTSP